MCINCSSTQFTGKSFSMCWTQWGRRTLADYAMDYTTMRSITYSNVQKWQSVLKRVCGEEIPILLCGNKVDLNMDMKYYDISAKTNYQYEKPFIWLAGKLMSKPNLDLVTKVLQIPQPPNNEYDEEKEEYY